MQTHGFVVGFEYRACPRMEFTDIVEEFDLAFQFVDAQTRALVWDCDDIALIERDYVRVALGWLPPDEDEGSWHLIAAVGPVEGRTDAPITTDSFARIADQIVERTQAFLPADTVLRGEAHQPIGPELIDSVFDLLRGMARQPDDAARETPHAARTAPAPDDLSDLDDGEVIDAVPALAPKAAVVQWLQKRAEPTKPLRLTIHTLAVTMMLYAPPLGAFMFVYTMLRDIAPVSA